MPCVVMIVVVESSLIYLSFRHNGVHVCMSICLSFASSLATVYGKVEVCPLRFKSTIACSSHVAYLVHCVLAHASSIAYFSIFATLLFACLAYCIFAGIGCIAFGMFC